MGNRLFYGEESLPAGSSDPIAVTIENKWKFENENVKDLLYSYRSHSKDQVVQYAGVIFGKVSKENFH